MKYLLTLTLVFWLFGSSADISAEWTNPNFKDRSFSKIVIFAISEDQKVRNLFEAKVVRRLQAKKINAIKGNTLFPKLAEARELGPKQIIEKLRENGIDGVITMALVKTDQKIGYQKGKTYSVTSGTEGFGTYFVTHYKTISEPGYMESKKIFLIESNLFDLKGGVSERQQALVWKGQSELVNPATKYDAAVNFSKPLVKYLIKKKIIRAKPTPRAK